MGYWSEQLRLRLGSGALSCSPFPSFSLHFPPSSARLLVCPACVIPPSPLLSFSCFCPFFPHTQQNGVNVYILRSLPSTFQRRCAFTQKMDDISVLTADNECCKNSILKWTKWLNNLWIYSCKRFENAFSKAFSLMCDQVLWLLRNICQYVSMLVAAQLAVKCVLCVYIDF